MAIGTTVKRGAARIRRVTLAAPAHAPAPEAMAAPGSGRARSAAPAPVLWLCAIAAVLAGAAGLTAADVQAQTSTLQLKDPAPVSIAPVRENLYMISGEGGNVAALVTDEGIVLIDDMFERNHDGIVNAVASVSDQPIRFVINTHQHDDHAGGDRMMLPIAAVIAHDNVRANLSHIRQPYYEDTPGLPIGLPNMTFADAYTIHLGETEVRARYFGRGHTSGDIVVYFPAQKTIHTGDLFLALQPPADSAARDGAGGGSSGSADRGPEGAVDRGSSGAGSERPRGVNIYVDYAQGGSFLDWTTTLDRMLALDFETVIPGHGPVSTRADVIRFRADLEAMRDRIAGMIHAGATKAQVVATFENDYGWRATGCPPSPPTPGCLQFQQMDSLIEELSQ